MAYGDFLRSKNWEAFQYSLGRKTFNLGAGIFVIKLDMPWFGKSYLYTNFSAAADMTDKIDEIAENENAVFLKLEPMECDGELPSRLWQDGWRKSNKELQPQKTIIVDLSKTETHLLAQMHAKTRYNINIAHRHGVAVEFSIFDFQFPNKNQASNNQSNLRVFWKLLQQTAQRDKFYTHSEDYYRKLLSVKGVELVVALGNSTPLAAALIIVHGDTATYLHGASSYEHRALMAPHLLHWEIMRAMRNRGLKHYDFWGANEQKWPGVTRFKRGFGGREVSYIGSYDLPLQKMWYLAYSAKQLLGP